LKGKIFTVNEKEVAKNTIRSGTIISHCVREDIGANLGIISWLNVRFNVGTLVSIRCEQSVKRIS